jgi:hypothetical protein
VDTTHPVHALCSALERQRRKFVETLAAHRGAVPQRDLQDLAELQMALMAVREEIETHSFRLGWGDTAANARPL